MVGARKGERRGASDRAPGRTPPQPPALPSVVPAPVPRCPPPSHHTRVSARPTKLHGHLLILLVHFVIEEGLGLISPLTTTGYILLSTAHSLSLD